MTQSVVSDIASLAACIEQKRQQLGRPVVVDVPDSPCPARGDFSRLWNEVWVPNEFDFERHYSPRERADLLYIGRPLTLM